MKKTICFDLDGTLIDSSPGIKMAFELAASDIYNVSIDFETKYVGPTVDVLHDIYFSSFSLLQKTNFIVRFRHHYDHTYYGFVHEYTEVSSVLKKIHSMADYELGIFTNKPTLPTKSILQQLTLIDYFNFISCVDSDGMKKSKSARVRNYIQNNPEKNCILFVGDTMEDFNVSQENRIKFAYASYGYGDIISNKTSFYTLLAFNDLLTLL